jgi:MFS family permease
MLTVVTFGPLYGKLADILGRKLVLYPSIAIFLVRLASIDIKFADFIAHLCIERLGLHYVGPRKV